MTTEPARLQRSVDEYQSPVSAYQMLLRLRIENRTGNLGKVTTAIGEAGGDIGVIDIQEASSDFVVRDVRVHCHDEGHAQQVVEAVAAIPGVEVQHASDRTFQLHRHGKIRVENKVNIRTMAELAHVYTPGVARVSMQVHDNPDSVWSLTTKVNTVAVVTDGTAVLGLGDIGPEAAMPVMEGKCMLFKSFGEIDAWPICLNTKDPDEIVMIVKALSPGFGGILLEDISAPRCFEIEERLRAELDIPVFHDDQHGTAVVVLAALINALKVVQKRPEDLKMVLTGVGASGVAVSKILMNYGVKHIIGFDRTGAVYQGRDNLNPAKVWFAEHTNPRGVRRHAARSVRRRRFLPRPLRPAHGAAGDGGRHGPRRHRVRARQPGAGDPAGADRGPGTRDRHRALRLPEPGEQRALLPRPLPRHVRQLRHDDLGGHEDRRRPRHRQRDPGRSVERGLHPAVSLQRQRAARRPRRGPGGGATQR